MPRPSKLTPEQWAAARRRWEGAEAQGFEWLRQEAIAAFGDAPSRPAMRQMAEAQGWKKGGDPSTPLAPVAVAGPKVSASATRSAGGPSTEGEGRSRAAKPSAAGAVAKASHPKPTQPGAKATPAVPPSSESLGLSAAQERFAVLVAQGRTQTDAYLDAYPASKAWQRESVYTEASKLASDPKVAPRITELVRYAAEANAIDVAEVFRQYLLRLQADPRELVTYRVSACRYCHSPNGRYQYTDGELERAREAWEVKREQALAADKRDPGPFDEKGGGGYSKLMKPRPGCPECAGEGHGRTVIADMDGLSEAGLALYAGVKESKEGIEVKMADRDAALEKIARHLKFFGDDDKPPEVNVTIDLGELDTFYREALEKSKAAGEAARNRMRRILPDPGPVEDVPDAEAPSDAG